MHYVHFTTNDKEYLTQDNKLSKNKSDAVLIEEELVGERISRFKFCIKNTRFTENKYLACQDNDIYFSDRNDDAILFVKQSTYSYGMIHYITVRGKALSISKKLSSTSLPENNELPPTFTNLTVTYIHPEKVLLEKFREDGIIFWKHHYWGDNLFESAKNKILDKIIDDIFLFFFFNNFVMQTSIGESLKGMLGKIFPNGYILNNHSFEKNTYHNIRNPYFGDNMNVRVIFALDDLKISYKEKSFLSYDVFSEKVLDIPKGNIVLLRFDLWYRIVDFPSFIIANYSSK
jgi:hypothetical protein